MKVKALTAAMIGALMLTGCQTEEQNVTASPLYVSTVQVDAPVKNQFRTFKGEVVPAEKTPIAFRSTGELREVYVKAGDHVEVGQLIARLDDNAVRQTYNDAKARYTLASRQLERGRGLRSNEMISEAELDELQANAQLARAQFALAQNQLKYTELKAPFTGTVSDVPKERFERVQAGEPVVNLYQDGKVYVQIELSDNLLSMINPTGERIPYTPQVTFSGIDGDYQMRYLEHTSEPNEQTGSYEMWLSMAQVSPEILPGTSATISVDMVQAGILAVDGYKVPMTVLQAGDEKGRFYVWKLKDDQVNRIEVAVSEVTGDGAIVASGISEGDILVNSNLRKLREGKKVEATEKSNG
ncbi:efflux RND transporter periplasmic adaptor subunit [Grimontia indica]|uniref:efflux RND transporter periplasmic adaptor subunit n=1 Tax=Grimontia indica TaxID=1056512 RepID=UPI00034C6F4B|nr:efflux RND transporter periplasmic adaptor subunit [Grimontia indica]